MDKLKIFISGTQDDMKAEREAVDRAVNATTLATGIRAETAVSQSKSPHAWIEEQIRECNIYIGVYSHRYGWVIPSENVSATEFEYNLACALRKPRLIWVRKLREDEKSKLDFDRQYIFLNRVSDFSTGHLRQEFDNPADLEKWVIDALRETFTEIIRRGTVPTASKFLVPFPHNPDFVGRDADLATLHTMLQRGSLPVGIRPTILVGLGGIGKTQLAVEYAHVHRADYPDGIFWLNAINPLLFEFAKMAELLELADTGTPRDTAAQRCYEYLNQHTDALVIFDNVEEPGNLNVPFAASLIPANLQCRTLFTTRKRDFPSPFQPFEVKTLPEAAAMRLLLRHPSRQKILEPNHPDHALARVICVTLGYLPLALALAGAFLDEHPDISLFDYRVRLLEEGAIEVVDATDVRPEDMPTRHETAVRATLQTSWNALDDVNAQLALLAAGQLREAALIPIPSLGLLTGLATEAKPGYPVLLTQALKRLYTASLVEELTADRLRLHPLVHAFAAQLAPPTLRDEMAIQVVTTFENMTRLQNQVIHRGIDAILDDLKTGVELSLDSREKNPTNIQLSCLERVLDREAHNLRDWNANQQASFFLQQFRNRALDLDYDDLMLRAETQLSEWKLPYLRERFPVSRESKELVRTLEGHSGSVKSVAVTADGRWAVSASKDKTLKVWDVATGQAVRTLEGHTRAVNAVVVTADGRWAVSASQDKTLKVWDVATGHAVRTLKGHIDVVNDVTVTVDGRWAVSASADKTLKVWDLATGQSVRTLEGHSGSVNSVGLTADGRWAVSAFENKTLQVWDLTTGQSVRTLKGHKSLVADVAVTADGRWAVSASADKTLKVWDLATGRSVHTLKGHTDAVNGVAVMADGRWAVSASKDKTLQVWNLTTGQVVRTLEGHTGYVNSVAMTADGHWAVSASKDTTIQVWDISTALNESIKGKQSLRAPKGHLGCINSVVVTTDGYWAVSASLDRTLKVWDLATGQDVRTFEGHNDAVNDVAMTADGRWAVSASKDKTLKVWDVATGQAVRTLEGHTGAVNAVAVTADGRWAVSASDDETLQVWDLATGQSVRTLEGHKGPVKDVAVLADGRWAVSASADKTLKVWDIPTGQSVRTLIGHKNWVAGVAVTADGRWAVSASGDKTLQVWDLATGKNIQTLEGHSSFVEAVALTIDGHCAISVSKDKMLKIWDLATWQEVLLLTAAVSFQCCAIALDGRTIVAGDEAGAVHVVGWVKFE